MNFIFFETNSRIFMEDLGNKNKEKIQIKCKMFFSSVFLLRINKPFENRDDLIR